MTNDAEGESDSGSTTIVNNIDQPPLMQMNGTSTECWYFHQDGTCLTVAGLMMITNGSQAIEIVSGWGYLMVSNCSSRTLDYGFGPGFLFTDGGVCNHYSVLSSQSSAHLNQWSILYRIHDVSKQPWLHSNGFNLPSPQNGTNNQYQASDASAAMSAASSDTLLRVAWTNNATDDLNWALLNFTLTRGNMTYYCQVSGGDCGFDQTSGDDDTRWEHDEIIFVTETGTDICGGGAGSSCGVGISVSYNGFPVQGSSSANVV